VKAGRPAGTARKNLEHERGSRRCCRGE